MNREERVRILIDYLKKENTGYASLADPVDYTGRRRLLRSLMNVRWPGEADPEYTRIQDELLKEEAEQKGIVEWGQLPTIGGQFPCETIKNVDKISLWRGDITRLSVDAIVNAANSQMLGCFVPCHGCIDNAIHSAAGIQLRNECAQIMEAQGHEEPTGKAKITKGYNLPAKHVIHTVGPIVGMQVTEKQEEELKSCYLNCMKLAEKEGNKLSGDTSLSREDSFVRNYRSSKPSGFNKEKAYLIKEDKLPAGEFGVMHGRMPVSQLKKVAHGYHASLNEYFIAVFVWSVYKELLHGMPGGKPIRIAVPVNLRPYFDSDTTKNFFVMVSAEFRPQKESYTFEEVLACIQSSLHSQINKEHLEDLFSYSVSNQRNLLMRPVPLFLKNIAMRIVYEKSAVANTTTITNIGNIKIKDIYQPYIEGFSAFIAMSKGQYLKGTICSYQDTLVFTFSSIFSEALVQKAFFRKIAADGVDVEIETNGVYYE